VSVVSDPSVNRGGCLVESPFGFIDASIEAQLQELAGALLESTHPGFEGSPYD
jgi:flagellar biosynthesis/type III secretory pathway protein FliH